MMPSERAADTAQDKSSGESRMGSLPRISFGIIVLNGEPFTRYCLRSIYPFAHQIVVVEGASPHAAAIATPDGHSTDGTLETLRRFKAEEDLDGKVEIVTAEAAGHPNGFWPGEKDEQSEAYARRAAGDWLWQVDVDEFYRPEDMCTVVDRLRTQPKISMISFDTITFWGGLSSVVDGFFLRSGAREFSRLFRFGPGYRYVTHRPPTVADPSGQDLRQVFWVRGNQMAAKGVFCYHYASLLPKQVREKAYYHSRLYPTVYDRMPEWAENNFMRLGNPFRVHEAYSQPSWLEPFRGQHPPEILKMMEDIRGGRISIELRRTDDIEALLRSPRYRLGRWALKVGLLLWPSRLWTNLRYGKTLAPLRRAVKRFDKDLL